MVVVYCKGDDIPEGLDREGVEERDRIEVYLVVWKGTYVVVNVRLR